LLVNSVRNDLQTRDRIQRVFGEISVRFLLVAFLTILRLMNGSFDNSVSSETSMTMRVKTSIGKAMRSIMIGGLYSL